MKVTPVKTVRSPVSSLGFGTSKRMKKPVRLRTRAACQRISQMINLWSGSIERQRFRVSSFGRCWRCTKVRYLTSKPSRKSQKSFRCLKEQCTNGSGIGSIKTERKLNTAKMSRASHKSYNSRVCSPLLWESSVGIRMRQTREKFIQILNGLICKRGQLASEIIWNKKFLNSSATTVKILK